MAETTIAIPQTLFDQAETLARQLNISPGQLVETAIERFISNYPTLPDAPEQQHSPAAQPVINQGDLYWLKPDPQGDLAAGIPHPHVIIQDNLFNHSRITTVIACALTSNIKRVNMPGNVLLDAGEANLSRQSVVEVSKVVTVAKIQLGEYIGSLGEQRMTQILAGMRFLQKSFYDR